MMVTPCLPFRLILSSFSRVTPGDLSRTSRAVDPALEGEAATLTTMRSDFCSIKGLLPMTATSWRFLEDVCRTSGGSTTEELAADSSKGEDQVVVCPTVLAAIRYLPSRTWSSSKCPVLSVTVTLAWEESLALRREMVA